MSKRASDFRSRTIAGTSYPPDDLPDVWPLTTRIRQCAFVRYMTVDKMAEKSDEELLLMENFGHKSFRLLRSVYPGQRGSSRHIADAKYETPYTAD